MISLTPLLALVAPFFLWPIERFLPYPYVIEELTKGLLVLKGKSPVLVGFAFAFSETILYYFNLVAISSISGLFFRLIITSCLHVSTSVLMHRFNLSGLVLAMLVHFGYNYALAPWLIPLM